MDRDRTDNSTKNVDTRTDGSDLGWVMKTKVTRHWLDEGRGQTRSNHGGPSVKSVLGKRLSSVTFDLQTRCTNNVR